VVPVRTLGRHESTRIGGEGPPCTPRHRRFRDLEHAWDHFSPIVYAEVGRKGEEREEWEAEVDGVKRISNPEYLTLVRVEEEEEEEVTGAQTGVTFTCLSREDAAESSDPFDSTGEEGSLTRLGLTDLSCRLGGTGLCVSRDNGLDLTGRLAEGEGEEADRRGSRYDDTVEELEQLMVRLATVFDSFRTPEEEEGPAESTVLRSSMELLDPVHLTMDQLHLAKDLDQQHLTDEMDPLHITDADLDAMLSGGRETRI
jgi:hypothetical protein